MTLTVPLGLQESLPGLERTVPGQPDEAVLEKHARLDSEMVLLDEEGQYPGREDPCQPNRDQGEAHQRDHALDVQADADLVTGAVCLGTQSVEGCRHTLKDGQPHDVHGCRADACCCEVVRAKVTGDHDGDDASTC